MRVLHFSDKAHRVVDRKPGGDGLRYLPGRLEFAEGDPQEVALSVFVDVDLLDCFDLKRN